MTAVPTTAGVDRQEVPVSLLPGMKLATRMTSIWHRSKAKVKRLLSKGRKLTCPFPFPYEIVEMIIVYLTYNLDALKTCSLTCRSWYTIAVPFIHHTIVLTENRPEVNHSRLELLSELRELGLMPLVKQIHVVQSRSGGARFTPRMFNHHHLRHFSAFANVHTLRLQELDIHLFIPGIERYFEHFSPTVRSVMLLNPHCTPRQLSHFLSLFTNLDNLEIHNTYTYMPDETIPNTELVPFSAPKLQGRLILRYFGWVETWTHLITSCGGLRFHHADLRWSGSCTSTLLKACAETLETIRFDADGIRPLSPLNLSGLKALRSLQVWEWLVNFHLGDDHRTVVWEALSTITSSVFVEVVIVLAGDLMAHLPLKATLFEGLRKLSEVRPFKLVFLFEGSYHGAGDVRCVLARGLDSVITEGLLDFLDSPPTIRIA